MNTERFRIVDQKGSVVFDRWFASREEALAYAPGATVQACRTIAREDVISVYSGKAGRCCCGCSGKHSYASAHRDYASDHRGYAVEDSEVNDREVTRIVNLLNFGPQVRDESDLFSLEVNGRLYIAYMREGAAGDPTGDGEPPVCEGDQVKR